MEDRGERELRRQIKALRHVSVSVSPATLDEHIISFYSRDIFSIPVFEAVSNSSVLC